MIRLLTNIRNEDILTHANYDPRRVCVNPFLEIDFETHRGSGGVYIAGGLVRPLKTRLWCHFIDQAACTVRPWHQLAFPRACILSAHAKAPWGQPDTPAPVHVTFVGWIPGICSLLGFQIINLIDKDRIRGEDGHGARLSLFIGFALMAGGLAGSAVRLLLSWL
jgi:hypothetical protein